MKIDMRASEQMRLPLDYPRINQFPEWFTVEAGKVYTVENVVSGEAGKYDGAALWRGLEVGLAAGEELRMRVSEKR